MRDSAPEVAPVSQPEVVRARQPHWLELDSRWTGLDDTWISVCGRPVRILRGDATGGDQPQLLLHGLGGSAINWIEVMGRLRDYGPVVAVDLPGFGCTPLPAGGSARLRANRTFIRALVDSLGWAGCTLHGNSMGGLLSLLVAADHPQVVRGLVLSAPAAAPPVHRLFSVPPRAIVSALVMALPVVGPAVTAQALQRVCDRRVGRELVEQMFADSTRMRPTLVAALAAEADRHRQQAASTRSQAIVEAGRSLMAMLTTRWPVTRAVRAVTAPTLLLGGGADPLVPPVAVRALAARRRDWRLVVLDDVGHAPMLESPRGYLEAVGEWYAVHAR